MKKNIIKFGFKYFLWFVKFWYGLSMFLTRDRKTKVAEYTTYQEIVEAIDYGRKWRPDPLNGLLDVTTHPTKFQKKLNTNALKVEDCDGHAAYWCVSLLKNKLATKCWFSFFQMSNKDTGKITGHVVCVFEDHLGKVKWCDYVMPTTLDPNGTDWDWAIQSGNVFNATPIAAGMIEVKTKNDSIVFGKITKHTKF